MLDWLKKLGGGKPWQNKAGLEDKAVTLLAEDFSSLESIGSDLPTQIVRYLLDDEGEEVLARLTSTQGAGEALGIVRVFAGAGSRQCAAVTTASVSCSAMSPVTRRRTDFPNFASTSMSFDSHTGIAVNSYFFKSSVAMSVHCCWELLATTLAKQPKRFLHRFHNWFL